jgi:hypothetical protein
MRRFLALRSMKTKLREWVSGFVDLTAFLEPTTVLRWRNPTLRQRLYRRELASILYIRNLHKGVRAGFGKRESLQMVQRDGTLQQKNERISLCRKQTLRNRAGLSAKAPR